MNAAESCHFRQPQKSEGAEPAEKHPGLKLYKDSGSARLGNRSGVALHDRDSKKRNNAGLPN